MTAVSKGFRWDQNFVPFKLSVLAHGIKSEMKVFQLRFTTNDQIDQGFLLTQKLCLNQVICPWPEIIVHFKIHEKVCLKSDVKVILVKFPKTKILFPGGVIYPFPKVNIFVQNHENFILDFAPKALSTKICSWGVTCSCPKAHIHVLNHESSA